MSVIDLATAKAYLDVIHSADDAKLQMLLDGAEDEAVQYMNRPITGVVVELVDGEVTSAEVEVPASIVLGVMLLLQAAYQATPDDAEKLRKAAEVKLAPHRIGWGA